MSQVLYIMCGVGFSGKSTLAKKIAEYKNAVLVSQDGIYFESPDAFDQDNDNDWEKILTIAKTRIRENLEKGDSVVFDNTNTRRAHRDELRDIAKEYEAQTVVIYLDTSLETQVERQIKNKESAERHDVKQEYLDAARAELEIPASDENVFIFTPDTNINDWLKQLP